MFFATYEYSRYCFKRISSDGELGFFQALLSGGFAGFTCCVATYPLDVIKTRLQCEIMLEVDQRQYKPKRYDGGFSECAKAIYRSHGAKGNLPRN